MPQEHNEPDSPLVLLVDDEPLNLQVVGGLLHATGYDITFAKNGLRALELAKQSPPDLILLDVMMPEIDGYEVCKRLKEDPETADVPIIFLTCSSQIEDKIAGFNAGGIDYLTKPCQPDEFLARVKSHVELKRAREQISNANSDLHKVIEQLHEANATQARFFSFFIDDLLRPARETCNFPKFLAENFDALEREQILSAAADMEKQACQAFELLKNLSEWVSVQAGLRLPQKTPFCLKDAADSALRELEHALAAKSLFYKNQISNKLIVNADEKMIATVLKALVSNAIKFTPRSGRITVLANKHGEFVEVSVRDTGVGMSPERIQLLLNPGERLTTAGTENEQGSGLGFILCQQIVQKHGGDMQVGSEPGKGSVFSFTLPLNG